MNKRQRKKVLKKSGMNIAIVIGDTEVGDDEAYHHFPIGSKVIVIRHFDSSTEVCVECDSNGKEIGTLEQYIAIRDLKFI